MTATAYPLQWPEGWPRTKVRAKSSFKATLSSALREVQDELRRLGAKSVTFSSNVTLADHHPVDTGVAVYFVREGRQLCIPCDRWDKVEDNLRAIAKTIEALRGIERWGAKHMLDAAFNAFAALPPAPNAAALERPWREVLGVTAAATMAEAEAAYRDLARKHHPDITGDSGAMMTIINRARDKAREELQ